MSQRIIIIYLISLCFAFAVGSGFYGYGIDFHGLYTRPNLNMGDYQNWLGYRLSSLSVYGNHVGVHLLTLLLSLSTGFLFNDFCRLRSINSKFTLAVFLLITLHTWPIIMSATNAMRQGYCMSLVFFSLSMLLQNKKKLSLFFLITSIFLHKTGIFFLIIFFNLLIVKKLIEYFKENSKRIFLFLVAIFLVLITFYSYHLFLNTGKVFRVVNGDFRFAFLIINISFIIYFIYKYEFLLKHDVCLFLFIFSCSAIPVLLIGYNWQYERLNMMMTLPYIFVSGILFNNRSIVICWMILILILLFLTIYQGMYNALVDEYTFKKVRGLL